MGILGRYIVREFLRMLIPLWFSLGFVLFLLEWLAQVFKTKASAGTVLALYGFKMPSHLSVVFPVAVLLTALIVLGTMNRQNEVVAAQSLGAKPKKILFPALLAVFLASLVNFWVVNQVAPWGMRRHYEMQQAITGGHKYKLHQIRKEKIWYRNKDVLYNVGFFALAKQELYEVTIYTFDENFNIAQTLYARKATWSGDNWLLEDGILSIIDTRLETPVSEKFSQRRTRLIEPPKTLKRVEFHPDTLGQSQLWAAIKHSESLGINTAAWEVVYHSRLSFFLISFVFLLLAFPMALKFKRTGSSAKDSGLVAALCMTYWLIFSFGVNLGSAGKLHPAIATWSPPLLFLICGFIVLRMKRFAESRF